METPRMPPPFAMPSAEVSTGTLTESGDEDHSLQVRGRETDVPMDGSKAPFRPPPPSIPPEASVSQVSTADTATSAKVSTRNDTAVHLDSQTTVAVRASLPPSEPMKDTQQTNDEKIKGSSGARGYSTFNSSIYSTFNSSIYSIPSWSAAPTFPFRLEVIKDGAIADTREVTSKGAYMFGRSDQCDFVMEHPSTSRFHAVLQFKRTGEAFLYDLGSTHGTIMNKKKIAGRTYVPIHVGDVFKLGLSSRLFVLQGPAELMPKEGPGKDERQILREHQGFFETADRDASLLRAKREAEGATWGMSEDAIDDDSQEEELTWQTYKGQLSEKQQKTLDKIHKRNEKVASLKREIDAIQVKEIPQGGLTQGQQTQVARNQQRIEQLMEELDNLEETLNQSIQESTGARSGKNSSRKGIEDEDEDTSENDDFYDRTSLSKKFGVRKVSEPTQVVETAESLLEKRADVLKELERLNQLLQSEEKNDADVAAVQEPEDPLDVFMTTVSKKLESDRASSLKQEINRQQEDLNRIVFLLKVADPSGEAQRNWPSLRSETVHMTQTGRVSMQDASSSKLKKEETSSMANKVDNKETNATQNMNLKEVSRSLVAQENEQPVEIKRDGSKGPLWLGHKKIGVENTDAVDASQEVSISDQDFVEYKERHASMLKRQEQGTAPEISEDACGLILRKPKDVTGLPGEDDDTDKKIWEGAALAAADTVALLLRHQRGLGAIVDDEIEEDYATTMEEIPAASKKRKLGPNRPEFLKREEDKFQTWVPPAGQTGDGRTALNEKYGY